jgi:hypothetical protein
MASYNSHEKEDIQAFQDEIRKLIEKHDYPLQAIINTDETPLFYENQKSRTIDHKGLILQF